MLVDAFGEPYLCVDATGVLVLAKEKCRHGQFWVLVAPEKHVLYGYSKRARSSDAGTPLDASFERRQAVSGERSSDGVDRF